MALKKRLDDFQNALKRLNEAYQKTLHHQGDEEYSFFRDSTIQRFEFTLEIAWKSIADEIFAHIKEYLPLLQKLLVMMQKH